MVFANGDTIPTERRTRAALLHTQQYKTQAGGSLIARIQMQIAGTETQRRAAMEV